MNAKIIRKFIRFGLVGTTGFLIDFSIAALLYELLNIPMLIATGAGFCVAATTNYLLNRRWTWRSKDPNIRTEFLKFFAVSLIGLAIHYMVVIQCQKLIWLTISFSNLTLNNDWTSKIVATAVVLLWNFFANNFYTFRNTHQKPE